MEVELLEKEAEKQENINSEKSVEQSDVKEKKDEELME